MSAAGFRDVTTHTFTASARIESAEHYLQVMERSGAGFAALRKKSARKDGRACRPAFSRASASAFRRRRRARCRGDPLRRIAMTSVMLAG